MATNGPYDVIVVGAGITGAMVAWTLAQEGQQVVVLEATAAMGGTVRRQPGLALLGTAKPFVALVEDIGEDKAHTIWELTSDNLVRMEILLEQNEVAVAKPGSLRLAADPQQSAVFRDSATQLRAYGYDVELEDDNKYEDLVAINTHDDLIFSPQDLVEKLLNHENIVVELEAEAYTTKERADGSIAVWAHDQYLWADKVVYANGIHGARFTPQIADRLSSTSVHTVVFDGVEDLGRPLILDDGHICFLPYQSQGFLTGWTEEEQHLLDRLRSVAEQLCPDAIVHERFTTRIATTADQLPIVGQLVDKSRVYFVNGLGPLGLNLAAVAADEMTALILEDTSPEIFGLDRFDQTM